MAMIYGREADLDKVRADEEALRDAMQRFVTTHNFTVGSQFGSQVPQDKKRTADVVKPVLNSMKAAASSNQEKAATA